MLLSNHISGVKMWSSCLNRFRAMPSNRGDLNAVDESPFAQL